MVLKDTVKLVTTTPDGYGDKTATLLSDVKCLFIQKTGYERDGNQEGVNSDATIYLDKTNPVVLANFYRLEGMYIVANPFGQPEQDSWYRIMDMSVGQRKLLDNAIDNIHCNLEKVAGVPYVLIS